MRLHCIFAIAVTATAFNAYAEESWVGRKVTPKLSGFDKFAGIPFPAVVIEEKGSLVKSQGQWISSADLVRIDEAEEYYSVLISTSTQGTDIYTARLYRGFTRFELYRANDAIEDFSIVIDAIAKSPNPEVFVETSIPVRIARAYCYGAVDKFENAMQDFTCVIALPGAPLTKCYFDRAYALQNLGRYQESIGDYSRAISLATDSNPTDSQLSEKFFLRGKDYAFLFLNEKAIADFDRAIALRSDDPSYYFWRQSCYVALGDYAKAIEDISRAIQLAPKHAEYYLERSEAYCWIGDFPNSIKDVDAALEIDPNSSRALLLKAGIIASCPDPNFRNGTTAVQLARRGCEILHWEDSQSVDVLACAYAEMEEYDEAIHWEQMAMTLDKDRGDSRLKKFQIKQPFRAFSRHTLARDLGRAITLSLPDSSTAIWQKDAVPGVLEIITK